MNLDELIELIKINTDKANKKVNDYLISQNFFNSNNKYPVQINNEYDVEQLIKNAISADNKVIFELLLENCYYNLLQIGSDCHTIASYSFSNNKIEFLAKILSKLSNISIYKAFGFFPVGEIAIKNGNLNAIKFLSKYDYKFYGDHLHKAIHHGKLAIVKYFIEDLKIDIEAKNNAGYSPLQGSVLEQEFDIFNYLIASGAKIVIYNEQKENILLKVMNETENFYDTAGDFAASIKLKFKMVALVAFEKFCASSVNFLVLSNAQQQQVKIDIQNIIKQHHKHIEIDRQISSSYYVRPAQTVKNMLANCKIKLYANDEKVSADNQNFSLGEKSLTMTIAYNIVEPLLADFIEVPLSGE